MRGPAGVGKSAVAQSCAELLSSQNKLGAAFFFSRFNGRDDPNQLFTSISYQIATKCNSYGRLLDRDIWNDPTLVKKSVIQQFRELIVKPWREIWERGERMEEWVIVIDGLDECAGNKAQQDIIEVIAAFACDESLPFRWALFSRLDPRIMASFGSDHIASLSLHLELPVSRETDDEILLYLTGELDRIRREHGLASPWPVAREIATLVDLSGGLFIYAATVIRFVGEINSSGPVDQLEAVLAFAKHRGTISSDHPLAELDRFYTLIMQRIPSKVLLTIQKILLLKTLHIAGVDRAPKIASILGLSEPQFRNACGALHSVLELQSPGPDIRFYHASFMDFMQDQKRAKEFCIYLSCLDGLRHELLERLNNVHLYSTCKSISIDLTWPSQRTSKSQIYCLSLAIIFHLCQCKRPLDPSTISSLLNFQFHMIPRLWGSPSFQDIGLSPKRLRENIPIEYRSKIIERTYNPTVYLRKPAFADWERPYILGQGKNKVVCWKLTPTHWRLAPYPTVFGVP
ncbi:hypothetical protein P691DRAFT_808973 [Macrolepiota fuliginosa MF-IS2]|uniref:Nephrocystin 3-like N-terminal domain-containing protein n=1 Tax=Macrolepiota fuliginosa MF-IS2 TaxID=1400762 RepID=A0A9P6BWX8_9AGAR|nr:hypothetical protein P691DRAFT_808973 [Macrolepiota fuliginosa MF-IS2]